MEPSSAKRPAFERAREIFNSAGGTLRMAVALELGISRTTLYAMRNAGLLEQVSRGVYRLADLPPLGMPDLVTVAARVPRGVVCLISALAFHDLTSEVPHAVYLAVPRGWKMPAVDHPPIRIFRFSGKALSEGIEAHKIDGVAVRIYSAEKTVADCFKYRHKIGLDVALGALRSWRERKGVQIEALLAQARNCRVEKIMRPYVEALL